MIVTIDGPAGTGKSTVARRLAERLGFDFLDTGAMYRAVAARTLSTRIDPEDAAGVSRLARQTEIRVENGRTYANGKDVTDQLRTSATTKAASTVAQIVDVREALVQQQRDWSSGRDVVSEGRDQGTIAFPDAEVKFFLDADPLTRAKRRQEELAARGEQVNLDVLLAEQTARDEQDRNRVVAPLRPARDATVIDTTKLSLDEVIDRLEAVVRQARTVADEDVPVSSGSSG